MNRISRSILAASLLAVFSSSAEAYYAPHLGRWLTRDPIGYSGGEANLYLYVGGNPTRALDPTGETSYCGLLDANCPGGHNMPIPVFGDSDRARQILAIDGIPSGCVTLPTGIECTGNCSAIKRWRAGNNPSRTILDHEACHYCILKEEGFIPYICSGGRAPDDCVGNEVPTKPDW